MFKVTSLDHTYLRTFKACMKCKQMHAYMFEQILSEFSLYNTICVVAYIHCFYAFKAYQGGFISINGSLDYLRV